MRIFSKFREKNSRSKWADKIKIKIQLSIALALARAVVKGTMHFNHQNKAYKELARLL